MSLPRPEGTREPVVLSLPFHGRWLVRNSPARRVPSHGVDLFGERYAIDFVGVDAGRRTAERRDWRTLLATEPPERFLAFGRPVLAPGAGRVAHVHDGEVDHEGRRSQLSLLPYALGQAARVRRGFGAVAGNHVVIELGEVGVFVALVHLQAGSLEVGVGDVVTTGQQIAACGNSGNSTQPHVHLQVMDSADARVAQGVPLAFRHFQEWSLGEKQARVRDRGVPAEAAVVSLACSVRRRLT